MSDVSSYMSKTTTFRLLKSKIFLECEALRIVIRCTFTGIHVEYETQYGRYLSVTFSYISYDEVT